MQADVSSRFKIREEYSCAYSRPCVPSCRSVDEQQLTLSSSPAYGVVNENNGPNVRAFSASTGMSIKSVLKRSSSFSSRASRSERVDFGGILCDPLSPTHTVCSELAAKASQSHFLLPCFGLDLLLSLLAKFKRMWSRTGQLVGSERQFKRALLHSQPYRNKASSQRHFWSSTKFQLMLLTKFRGYSESGNRRGHNVHP